MAKKAKKANVLYIALGAVVGLGAIMGIGRALSNDKSQDWVDLKKQETDVQGYELVLTEEDPDKILEICRTAMDNSDYRWIEEGYTYDVMVDYMFCDASEGGKCSGNGVTIEIFYDYSENAEDDKFIVWVNGSEIITVDQSGIEKEDYTMPTSEEENMELEQVNYCDYKVVYGHRDALNEEEGGGYVDSSATNRIPDEISNLVRLVAPEK